MEEKNRGKRGWLTFQNQPDEICRLRTVSGWLPDDCRRIASYGAPGHRRFRRRKREGESEGHGMISRVYPDAELRRANSLRLQRNWNDPLNIPARRQFPRAATNLAITPPAPFMWPEILSGTGA